MKMAKKRVPDAAIHVDFLAQSAEDPVPLHEACVDTAVMTWTLCSIPNAPRHFRRSGAFSSREVISSSLNMAALRMLVWPGGKTVSLLSGRR
jgi:hypothetical protein